MTAYLNNASPLVGNNSIGYRVLEGPAAADARPGSVLASGSRRAQEASATVTTDASGRFSLSVSAAGSYNLEAVQSNELKAWKAAVEFDGSSQVDAGRLQLAPTGRISGRVQAADSGVTDFRNTHVYIPGSGHVAMTGSDGTFTIPHVPVGSFRLNAYNQYLGDADTGTAAVAVAANQTATAPPLIMAVSRPRLTSLTRLGLAGDTGKVTDNAGAGAALVLHGLGFGKSRGAPFSVLFGGASAATVSVTSDDLALATVPSGAANGEIYVRVGFQESNHLSFRVVKSFRLFGPTTLTLQPGETHDFSLDVSATDGLDAAFPPRDYPQAQPPVYKSNIAWRTTSLAGSISDDGLFTAISPGSVVVEARAGTLPAVVTVTIVPGGPNMSPLPVPPAQTPSPATWPTATPGPGQVAGPTPSPPGGPATNQPTVPPTGLPTGATPIPTTIPPTTVTPTPTTGRTSSPTTGPTGGPATTPAPTSAPTAGAIAVVRKVAITPGSLTLNAPPEGNEEPESSYTVSGQLEAIVDGEGPLTGVYWSSSDERLAKVSSSGLVRAQTTFSPGVVIITARSKDDATKFATASVTIETKAAVQIEIN